MTSYSVFGQTLPAGTTQENDSSTWDLGLQFSITASGYQLGGYYFYLPSSGNTTGSNYSFRLYSTANGTSGTLISGSTVSGSGTWTAASWVYVPLGTPVALISGTTYVAVVTISTATSAYYQFVNNYWTSGAGSGGITSGPITAPSNSASLGTSQQAGTEPTNGGMPTGNVGASFFGLDVNVTPQFLAPPNRPRGQAVNRASTY